MHVSTFTARSQSSMKASCARSMAQCLAVVPEAPARLSACVCFVVFGGRENGNLGDLRMEQIETHPFLLAEINDACMI